uniref:Uncharacterized protein n=1 Tax=Angiostrongylus cantonensis TaxID=6313 RepID=A0A0K0DBV4_ANGCA
MIGLSVGRWVGPVERRNRDGRVVECSSRRATTTKRRRVGRVQCGGRGVRQTVAGSNPAAGEPVGAGRRDVGGAAPGFPRSRRLVARPSVRSIASVASVVGVGSVESTSSEFDSKL